MPLTRRSGHVLVLAAALVGVEPVQAQQSKQQAEANRDRCCNGVLIGGASGGCVINRGVNEGT
ncbi:hypothetical protein [Synechococcus sp. MW101C3]|uniref:hypothetical protein n=1 Tax=Synechococcus sp. MW101C3 TaxID=210768 RepID=UPI0013031F37|nr:hypothetical protein [Synechococcus sp. MW101C3]